MTFRKLLTTTVLLAIVGIVSLQAQYNNKGVVSRPPAKGDKQEDANLRSVEGVVSDADRSLIPKAIVQLKDMKTLQIRSFVTSAEGAYHFAGLRMDTDYELKASVGDQTTPTKRVSSFETRKIVTVNLQMEKK
jgi:hypothetical protein